MKILHIAPSPKAGQTEHLPPHRAQALIDAGFAQAVQMPPRGTNAWLAAMREQEAERVAQIPSGQRENFPQNPTWSLRFNESTRKYLIVFQHMTTEILYQEVIRLDRTGRPDFKTAQQTLICFAKEAGCPKAVIDQYLAAANAPDYLAQERARIEADKQAANAQREREKHAPKYI